MRELDGEMHEIKEVCKVIPEAERIAPRRANVTAKMWPFLFTWTRMR